jgi:hypothetical protein
MVVWFAVGMLLLVVVLPSALNLPQSNPSTIAEYAPVPGDEDAPPGGNVSSLGLSSSRGLGSGTGAGSDSGLTGSAKGRKVATKRCVGTPLRQTEDPMAPPCVPFFDGDNGGATYQGVTRDEIVIVVYYTPGLISEDNGQTPPAGGYCDIDLAPNTGGPGCYSRNTNFDANRVRAIRALSRYFNDRFQTYDRHAHFWIKWASDPPTAESRRADAADIYNQRRPFAVINQATGGFDDEFTDAIADKKAMMFSTYPGAPGSFFRKNAPLVWNFPPDVEHWAEGYVDYVCTKVAPYPVAHATGGTKKNGQPMNGSPRKYALMYTTDPKHPGLQSFADHVRRGINKCGIHPIEVTFPLAGYAVNLSPSSDRTYAGQNVAKMKGEDVTTVIWAGGQEADTGHAADNAQYYPELVIAGDGILDGNANGHLQNQNWFRNAWTVTPQLRQDEQYAPGQDACHEADPSAEWQVCYLADYIYRKVFMLFQGIQVAGARLSPTGVDRGFHAIPARASNNPYMAACYFDPGDFTCVKDSMEMWWDPNAPDSPYSNVACWRMVNQGKRYLPGSWQSQDDLFVKKEGDTCTNTVGSAYFYR